MTERDTHLAEKKAAIQEITARQRKLMVKAARLMTKPYKRPETLYSRLLRVMEMVMLIKSLDMQKFIVMSQPIRKDGCSTPIRGMAIVGDKGTEVVLNRDGQIVSTSLTGSDHKTFMDIKHRMEQQSAQNGYIIETIIANQKPADEK